MAGVALLLALAAIGSPLAPSGSAASGQPALDGAPTVPNEPGQPLVDIAPLRCWWRTSAGAVALGEPFDVRLTCAVLETDEVQVVPDETRLAVAAVPLKPFEVIGGEHPADTRAGRRRFFQYRYTVRLTDAESIGQDVSLPQLLIAYKVQSRVAADSTLVGRDFTYLMPDLTIRVVSQVPVDANDIRDGADVGLERVAALQFRARLLGIGALASLAAAVLLGALAVVAAAGASRTKDPRQRRLLADRRVLAAAGTELSRVAHEAESGWTPDLVRAGHAALRVVAAIALGRRVGEQPLPPGEQPADGRIAVRGRLRWQPGAAVTSAVTPADLAAKLAASTSIEEQASLGAMRDALAAFTSAQFGSPSGTPDAAALWSALEIGQAEALRLAAERRWRWQGWTGAAARDAQAGRMAAR